MPKLRAIRPTRVLALVSFVPLLTSTGCLQPQIKPGDELKRVGDEIVVCGRLFHTGTRVVLWTDPGGFDGYRVHRRFTKTDQITPSSPVAGTETPNRYSPVRGNLPPEIAKRVSERGWSLEELQQVVDLFVMHYDVCGTSRRCFEVLHDVRGLSVHFMLDVDGTIYQTLDLKERARHAGSANDRSIGVEIAQMGAYAKPETLDKWYERDVSGVVRLKNASAYLPSRGLLLARNDLIKGEINGTLLHQYDFTEAQYDALIRLTAAINRVLPRVALVAPAHGTGDVTNHVLSAEELANHRGLIGHYHLTKDKSDPGPAFDWNHVILGHPTPVVPASSAEESGSQSTKGAP